jgi:hypothetical protein
MDGMFENKLGSIFVALLCNSHNKPAQYGSLSFAGRQSFWTIAPF